MNKSKILKRSLAIVLAVMMMVAMIPLSASAAAAPVISEVTVEVAASPSTGTQHKATLTGTDYAVEVPASPSITGGAVARVTLAAGNGYIHHAQASSNAEIAALEEAKNQNGQWVFKFTAAEVAAKKATFDVYDADVVKVGTYTISVSVTELERDTGVASVTVDGQYGSTVLEGNTYTITVPYAAPVAAATPAPTTYTATVKLNSTKSSVQNPVINAGGGDIAPTGSAGNYTIAGLKVTPADGSKAKFTVASEGGASTKLYYINLVKAEAFKSFSVAGERKAAEIDAAAKQITVYMPYGTKPTDGSWKFTPTFVTGYESVTVKADKANGNNTYEATFKSGEEVDLKTFAGELSATEANKKITDATLKLRLKYTADVTEDWTVKFDIPTSNPVAEITSAKVDNYVGTIDGKVITLTLPAAEREKQQILNLGVSNGNSVQVVGSGNPVVSGNTGDETATDDVLGIQFAANTLPNEATLRVAAAEGIDGNAADVQDYTLRIVTQEAKPAAITSATLEDAKGNKYAASIGTDYTVNFVLPYEYKTGIADTWKFYYEITSGSVLTAEADGANQPSKIKASGEAITANQAIWPVAPFNTATATSATEKLVVTTSSTNSHKYTVTFKLDSANAAAELSGLKLVKNDVTEVSKITATNSYAAVGTKDFVVTIPHRDYGDYNEVKPATGANVDNRAYVYGTLSDGAKLFYVDKTNHLVALPLTNEAGDTLASKLPHWAVNDPDEIPYDGVTKQTATNTVTALKLVVVSQGVNVSEEGTTEYDANFKMNNNGLYKEYTLTVKEDTSNTANQIKSVSLYDLTTKETVSATPVNYGFTLQVPDHFLRDPLVLTYDSDHYEIVYVQEKDANGDNKLLPLTFTDGARNANTGFSAALSILANQAAGEASIVERTSNDGVTPIEKDNTAITKLVSEPEAGGSTQEWLLVVKVDPADIGAELESVKIGEVTAKPDSSNKVTLTLPADTEITHVLPEFTLSKNATARVNGAVDAHVNGEDAYNLTAPIKVVVTSEDGNHTTTYTVEAKLDGAPSTSEAKLESVKVGAVTATPDSSKKVTLTLPAGTDLTKVAPEFTLAKNATAAVDGTAHVNGTSTYDMTKAITVVVTAEDGKTTATYTVEAKLADDQDPFTDVKKTPTAWYYDMLKQAKADGIIKGFDDGTFRPNAAISRQDFAVMLVNVLKPEDLANYTTPTFTDCTATYSQQAIAYLEAKKIVNGYGDGTFKPTKAITRAEVASVISKLLNLEDSNTTPFADDATLPGWAKTVIYRCKVAGIFTGDETGKFNASKNMTRAEAAQVMVRLQPKLK